VPIRTARLYRARRPNGSTIEEQLLGQRRLARIRVADDGERAATADLVGERGGRESHGFGSVVKVEGLAVLRVEATPGE